MREEIKDNSTPILDDERRFEDLVSLSNLIKIWKSVRREAKEHRVRDPIDYLDWAVSIDATLPQIRESLLTGDYIPSHPARYALAKTKGSFRIMTIPNIKDALIYRMISDRALELALPMKVRGAFYYRRHKITPVGKTFNMEEDPYLTFFQIWLRYQEYRTRTLLNEPYHVLVVGDISNYFDSIPHELLMEYLSPLGLPRKAIGLLGRILEVLKPPAGHSPNPRIGIPVDEFDCSRQLAHIFLFEHDRRVVKKVGEENYARWMDDHNIGAKSETDARQIVNHLTNSLSSQRLTLHAGKTQFLIPEEVAVHFHLDANTKLNDWETKYKKISLKNSGKARSELEELWEEIESSPGNKKGYWDKVLKRVYALAAKVDSTFLDNRMYSDLVEYPHLDERIFLSLARRNKGEELFDLFSKYCEAGESLFEATEAAFFEACLLLDANSGMEERLRNFATDFVNGEVHGQSGGAFGKGSALLCLYWYDAPGDMLKGIFDSEKAVNLPAVIARAWLAVMAARDPATLPKIQAKLVGHPSDDVARLSRFLTQALTGGVDRVGNYKHQKSRWPSFGKYYDARAWLQLEILSQAKSGKLMETAKSDLKSFSRLARSHQEKRILSRINAGLK